MLKDAVQRKTPSSTRRQESICSKTPCRALPPCSYAPRALQQAKTSAKQLLLRGDLKT